MSRAHDEIKNPLSLPQPGLGERVFGFAEKNQSSDAATAVALGWMSPARVSAMRVSIGPTSS